MQIIPPERLVGLVWLRAGTCSDSACPNHDPATETSREVGSWSAVFDALPDPAPERP